MDLLSFPSFLFWNCYIKGEGFYGMAFLKNLFEMTSIPATSNASIHLMVEAAYQVIVSILGLVRNARNNGLRIATVNIRMIP